MKRDTHLPKSSTFVASVHRIVAQNMFLANVRQAIVFFFGKQWLLPWNSPMDAVFSQSLS